MIYEGKDIKGTVREEADVCIIGSGAGGATVALELAQRGMKVVVLEEGGAYFTEDFDGKIKRATKLFYRNQGMDATLGVPAVLVPTGKCLGGTTVINMGTCFRAPDNILELWEEAGLEGWGVEGLAPYYDRVEERMSIQPVKPEVMGKNGETIAMGAEKLGLHPQPIRRNVNDKCRGCGNCAYGCTEAAKEAMVINAVPQASEAGAVFYCDTRAQHVLNDGRRATGVHATVRDRETGSFRYSVDISAKVVVLSCGALHTPSLLLKNGIANKSGKVGKHLKLHLAARTIGIFDEVIDAHRGVCQNLYIDDYLDQGIMLEATFTGPASQVPGTIGIGQDLWDIVKQYRHIASLGIMISEKTEGRVRADDNGDPVMTFHIGQEDARTLQKAMLVADRVLFAAGAKKVMNGNLAMPVINTVTELEDFSAQKTRASDYLLMAFHPQGTCRMGTDPKKSVVNGEGRSHDIENLYIADASVFPTSLGVNPQETIWAVSSKISEGIAADHFSK